MITKLLRLILFGCFMLILYSSTRNLTDKKVFGKTQVATVQAYFPTVIKNKSFYSHTIFSIPIGEEGVSYKYIGDKVIEGPSALTVLADDTFVIGDQVANRLVQFSRNGILLKKIDLDPWGILNIMDLETCGDDLLVLEINPNIVERVNVISLAGELVAQHIIPEGLQMANGLSGIAVGGENEILLELGGGVQVVQLVNGAGDYEIIELAGYPYSDEVYTIENNPGENPRITFGSRAVETQLTTVGGGLRLLSVAPNGDFKVIRTDLGPGTVIHVDATIHSISANGIELGLARDLLAERVVYVRQGLIEGLDGNVYSLITRQNQVDVAQLVLYDRLLPLSPDFVEPHVTLVEN